ncbi:TLD-domain-containing protein [Polychytrium aggregatum]|uniref:TLD-domain-containing protein n=1 Tax=Polychytrium aggregatum TaxID=110093 RepID=UPI0022FDD439|nr:TLD-domain-containing protein [Polychytrium aggregatum]KAI9197278.1 TLD-domain-containing protein [Polychytrium aggregatum]
MGNQPSAFARYNDLPGLSDELSKQLESVYRTRIGAAGGAVTTVGHFASYLEQTLPALCCEPLREAFVEFVGHLSSIGHAQGAKTASARDRTISLEVLAVSLRVLAFGSPDHRQPFVDGYMRWLGRKQLPESIEPLCQGLSASLVHLADSEQFRTRFLTDGSCQRFGEFLAHSARRPVNESNLFDDFEAASDSGHKPRPPVPPSELWLTIDYSIWAKMLWEISLSRVFLGSALHPIYSHSSGLSSAATTTLKTCLPKRLPAQASRLLTEDVMFVVNNQLTLDARSDVWKLAFSTAIHGNSWTVFEDSILDAGSTVVLIRSKTNAVFGGYASQEWNPKPKFYGDSSSFLFTVSPSTAIYPASGVNGNYQYFNSGTKTLPNGLGFGGQFDYFALWIDSSFGKGYSKGYSSTYVNAPLNGPDDFEIDFVEVWIVKEKEVDDRLVPKRGKKSILETNPEVSAILEMSGRRMYSKELSPDQDTAEAETTQE